MAYQAPEIKDRIAVGDDLYQITDQDGKKKLTPAPTEVTEPGTPINKALLQPLVNAVARIDSTAELKHAAKTATLTAAGWSDKSQTVAVEGVTAINTVFVAPDSASQEVWGKAGIVCTAQAAGSLTFTCKSAPSAAVTANIVILGG